MRCRKSLLSKGQVLGQPLSGIHEEQRPLSRTGLGEFRLKLFLLKNPPACGRAPRPIVWAVRFFCGLFTLPAFSIRTHTPHFHIHMTSPIVGGQKLYLPESLRIGILRPLLVRECGTRTPRGATCTTALASKNPLPCDRSVTQRPFPCKRISKNRNCIPRRSLPIRCCDWCLRFATARTW